MLGATKRHSKYGRSIYNKRRECPSEGLNKGLGFRFGQERDPKGQAKAEGTTIKFEAP
jgi:hypothetical protein